MKKAETYPNFLKIRIRQKFLAIELCQSEKFALKEKSFSKKTTFKQQKCLSHGRLSTATTKLSYTELLAITNVFSIAWHGLLKHCIISLMSINKQNKGLHYRMHIYTS